jgi:hypothetical protein
MGIKQSSGSLPTLLAMALMFWAGSASAEEQRCRELESRCICSEPLNTTNFVPITLPDDNAENLNPADSTTKACNSPNTIQVYDFAAPSLDNVISQVEDGMPSVNTVDRVFRWNKGHGGLAVFGNYNLQPSTKRVCFRHYLRMSPDYDGGDFATNPSSPNCDAGKFTQMKFGGNSYDNQMGSGGHRGRGQRMEWWHTLAAGGSVNQPSSGSLAYSDCYGHWCRLEVCVSGNFAGSGNLFSEAYVVRLSDGKRRDWPRFSLGTGSPGLRMDLAWIVNAFRGTPNDPLTCGNGVPADVVGAYRDLSHAMQAEWDTDVAGTFIGPAYEVEGGGSAAPPPPPPSDSSSSELGKPGTPTYTPQ